MVLPATSSGALVLSLKLALISTGVLSAAVILKNSAPLVSDFSFSDLPVRYSSLLSWLRPPYLYLVINCIIISIVASSKLHLHKPHQDQPDQPFTPITPLETAPLLGPVVVMSEAETVNSFDAVQSEYVKGIGEDGLVVESGGGVYGGDEGGNVFAEEITVSPCGEEAAESSIWEEAGGPQRSDSKEFLYDKEDKDKPLVSSRFGHRKSLKASPEVGKTAALGVSRSKRNDTLESTWKTITEGRSMPLTRHRKKSDTWDSHMRGGGGGGDATLSPAQPLPLSKMKKSETFSEDTSKKKLSRSQQKGSEKPWREPSLSQEELNRRVEAFISKFNEEMRLQRLASLNKFHEMISRGA